MLKNHKSNGTRIAELGYKEDPNPYRSIGELIFHRPDAARVKLNMIPAQAWSKGAHWFFGRFEPSDKVPEAPFIDGDLLAPSEARGEPLHVGHIHTRERAEGGVQYYMELFGVPTVAWRKVIAKSAEDEGVTGKGALSLEVRMN